MNKYSIAGLVLAGLFSSVHAQNMKQEENGSLYAGAGVTFNWHKMTPPEGVQITSQGKKPWGGKVFFGYKQSLGADKMFVAVEAEYFQTRKIIQTGIIGVLKENTTADYTFDNPIPVGGTENVAKAKAYTLNGPFTGFGGSLLIGVDVDGASPYLRLTAGRSELRANLDSRWPKKPSETTPPKKLKGTHYGIGVGTFVALSDKVNLNLDATYYSKIAGQSKSHLTTVTAGLSFLF